MSLKILIIEDEPDIRKNLEYNLSREGYSVLTAASITEAEQLIYSNNLSLILLDLMLPDGSGLELCKKMKSDPDVQNLPIIILTAKDDEVDKVVGFEIGADDYVTKPFSVRELILRIKAVLKRGENKKDIVEIDRQFGDLKIDIDSHEVYVDGELINLTALEFKLLTQLVDRRGRVQSREQLLADVWGYSAEVTTRTVDTHIKRLREKLGTMGKYVQTIRGVGYKFSRSPDQ
jgi:two-component system phosphate regulon response regulator PhoB